jgi:hypothetical protein
MIYDYIIVGAGIGGLYAAYNIKKIYPDKKFLILEENSKKYIGGHIREDKFANHLVTTGAGVGRKHKDKFLIKLLKELDINYNEFLVDPKYSFEPANYKKTIQLIKEKFIEKKKPRVTFREFVLPLLGQILYKQFV